jgi:hypothetical protein
MKIGWWGVGQRQAVFTAPSITKLQLLLSTTYTAVYALLVLLKYTMPSPFCTGQDNKIVPRGNGVSLSGTGSTSLSGILMLAGASLHGALLGGTLGLADASLRGTSLSGTFLLADASLCRVSLAKGATNGTENGE